MLETETDLDKKPHHILQMIGATQGMSETKAKKLMVYANVSLPSFIDSLINREYNKDLLTELRFVRAGLEEMALANPGIVSEFSNKYDWLCNIIKTMTIDLSK